MKKKLLTVLAVSLFGLSFFGTTAAKMANAPVIVVDGARAWAG